MKTSTAQALYKNRKLSSGYPDLEKLGVSHFAQSQSTETRAPRVVREIEAAIELPANLRTIATIGCGPKPESTKTFLEAGWDAIGIEPLPDYVRRGQEWIGDAARVKQGSAEDLPLEDCSQAIVLMEGVLEHVDSPLKSLQEVHRVLAPGGVAYIQTTNRRRLKLSGHNGEYNVPFLNLMPAVVRESFTHHHIHFNPKLANYTPRPAVHWFSFTDLCTLGRHAGFYQFYSRFDLVAPDDPAMKKGLRRWFLNAVRYNPWFRAIGLLQFGDSIFMLKRPA